MTAWKASRYGDRLFLSRAGHKYCLSCSQNCTSTRSHSRLTYHKRAAIIYRLTPALLSQCHPVKLLEVDLFGVGFVLLRPSKSHELRVFMPPKLSECFIAAESTSERTLFQTCNGFSRICHSKSSASNLPSCSNVSAAPKPVSLAAICKQEPK